jgi:hypothetical protein
MAVAALLRGMGVVVTAARSGAYVLGRMIF